MTEIWKDIKDYEGIYQISNLGRVKSLPRKTNNQFGKFERILSNVFDPDGYLTVCLRKNGSKKTYRNHHLVWDHFGHPKRDGLNLQVDHIDDNPSNPALSNLQLLSYRDNTVKARARNKSTNLPSGILIANGKYKVTISKNRKKTHIGYFETLKEAEEAYNKINEKIYG